VCGPDEGETVLVEAECRGLLAEAIVGRIAFSSQALPAVQPVLLAVEGNRLVIPVLLGGRVAASCDGAVVAVQVDSFEEGRAGGWSVQVVGPARVVTVPAEVAALDRLGLRFRTTTGSSSYLVVDLALVSGWRVGAGSDSLVGRAGTVSA
jgi:hypothetical protein